MARGRRPGSADTAADILDAARACFAERGFDATTVRAVAERAGVDPALVHHYFGSKRGLFLTALKVPFEVAEITEKLRDHPRSALGEAIIRYAIGLWNSPKGQDLAALLRTGLGDGANHTALQEVLIEGIVSPALSAVGLDEDEVVWRAPLMETVMLGLAIPRLVIDVPLVRAMTVDQLVTCYAPTLQRFIDAPRHELFGHDDPLGGGELSTQSEQT